MSYQGKSTLNLLASFKNICLLIAIFQSVFSFCPRAKTGQQLWTTNITSGCAFRPGFFFTEIVDGKFAWWKQETRQWFGFDAYTGEQIWGPTEPYGDAWSMFLGGYGGGGSYAFTIAYGKLYYGSFDGMLHCRDWKTGKYLWNYSSGNSGFETAFNHWPLSGGPPTVADGKVYIWSGEHTANSPLWRGGRRARTENENK